VVPQLVKLSAPPHEPSESAPLVARLLLVVVERYIKLSARTLLTAAALRVLEEVYQKYSISDEYVMR
jgi:hypothetical protein